MAVAKTMNGINPPLHKDISNKKPIINLPLPKYLIYPLLQRDAQLLLPIITSGNYVQHGQLLAKPINNYGVAIHASASGWIEDIIEWPIIHPANLPTLCIRLRVDEHADSSQQNLLPPINNLIDLLKNAGLAGLGGEGFPTYIKFNALNAQQINTIIINGAECEPYITCDDLLMQEHAQEICAGIKVLQKYLPDTKYIIAIEDNKQQAINAMQEALLNINNLKINLRIIPTQYPAGSEKIIIKTLLNKEILNNTLPIEHGIVCINIATLYSIYTAYYDKQPLTKRIITLSGNALPNPGNYRVPIGMMLEDLLLFTNNNLLDNNIKLAQGGGLMNINITNYAAPITKTTNCILGYDLPEKNISMPCIRCDRCSTVCPINLLPQQLYSLVASEQISAANRYHLNACIECGACDYVCPSKIPLVDYFRYAKAISKEQTELKQLAIASKQRFDSKTFRQNKNAALETDKRAAIMAAIARKKEQKNDSPT
jgi:electron transport complex protein RnfC